MEFRIFADKKKGMVTFMNLSFIILSVVLAVIILFLFLYLRSIKKQIRSISTQLKNTRDKNYNKQVTLLLVDSDLNNLAVEINHNLDYQKELKLRQEMTEHQMKQSISNIAHDLRTPLTVMKGNLQLMQREEGLTPSSRYYLDTCQKKTDSLRTIVDDFFELSVLESDTQKVPLSSMDAVAFLMQFILEQEAVIREHGFTPRIELPEKSIQILADEALLGRMLSNLLNNILKYGQETFRAGIRQEDGGVIIYFANEIKGNSNPEPDRLFERSYRADQARSEGSAGLGLYIVRLLSEKQNATVDAKLLDRELMIQIHFYNMQEQK